MTKGLLMKTNESTKVHQNLSLVTAIEAGKYWSVNEIMDLRELKSANASNLEIAQILGRSYYAISSKFNVVGMDGDASVMIGRRRNAAPASYGTACESCFTYHSQVQGSIC